MPKDIDALAHEGERRTLLPSAEHEPLLAGQQDSLRFALERRNRDLDPQLVWRGKDWQDGALDVPAPPLYIQERVHPRALIEELRLETGRRASERAVDESFQHDFFSDFNGLPEGASATGFYEHDAQWTNRMILGDSLQVMASLAGREMLRGQVQCVYLDPPYGIRFNSNFQWSTTSRDVRDGRAEHITREPEQVRAFRDTWRDGVHSYLGYLRDRLTAARDLLADSGSVFVQIGDENVHRVRAVMDEVFGEENFVSDISFRTKIPLNAKYLPNIADHLIWYSKDREQMKFRRLFTERKTGVGTSFSLLELPDGSRRALSAATLDEIETGELYRHTDFIATGYTESCHFDFDLDGRKAYPPGTNSWKTTRSGVERILKAQRLSWGERIPSYVFYAKDYPASEITNQWVDTQGAIGKSYVVQTSNRVLERCILMTTDPGDIVLDPTCGSGTTAYVAEQWGRRWIVIDTSRVALALARARIMGARYPWYLLADSPEGRKQAGVLSVGAAPEDSVSGGQIRKPRIREGFVYRSMPHITIGSIANNAEIDVIHESMQPAVEDALAALNAALRGSEAVYESPAGGRAGQRIDFTAEGASVELPSGESAPADALLEWEVPREAPGDWPRAAHKPIEAFWRARQERQRAIDESIARCAGQEMLYDRPYEDKGKVRVAGPFTVESLSPHRSPAVDGNGMRIPDAASAEEPRNDFVRMILDNLEASGLQQSSRDDRIRFSSLEPLAGGYVCAEARWQPNGDEDGEEMAAGVFVGPEFGTVGQTALHAAATEAAEAGFGTLIACAFSFDAAASNVNAASGVRVLKARMNADLHMSTDLKNNGAGNLFAVFGEPDIALEAEEDGQLRVCVRGVDVYDPATGNVRSDGTDGVACWFVDTDYNGEHFFVRHAYFLGASDPYKALRTTLKAEIDAEAWGSLRSDVSRPFDPPSSGRIAVKVINHLGDEVMKVLETPA